MPPTLAARLGLPLMALVLLAHSGASPAGAQAPARVDTILPERGAADTLPVGADTARAHPAGSGALVTLGGLVEDRWRVDELLGRTPPAAARSLLRSASTLTGPLQTAPGRGAVQLLLPDTRVSWNSGHPFSMNDGAMWAGRGANVQVSGGVRAAWGRVRATLAPAFVYQRNEETDYFPYPTRARSPFAFPWSAHSFDPDPYSIDLPSRFGDDGYWTVDPGQSTLSVELGPVLAGASTENQWWGPGVRNALVMSNNAAGVPHLFLRTGRPLRTRLGEVEGYWMAGALAESAYFDTIASNDTRSLSAVAVAFRPAGEAGLTVGAARAVYREVDGALPALGHALDAWATRVSTPATSAPPGDPSRYRGPDQVIALFGRWLVPGAGLEAYAEWARRDLPSFRKLAVSPNRGQGYTVGMQWARGVGRGSSALRLQAEATYLEQDATGLQRYVSPWYQSRVVPQGYTQRGQALGAGIGPGSSSQWLAGDWMAARWQLGAFAGRIRWHDDFHPYARIVRANSLGHDVSVFAGLRGGMRVRGGDLWAEYTGATRYNMHFQHRSVTFQNIDGVDRRNHTVRFGWTPRNSGDR